MTHALHRDTLSGTLHNSAACRVKHTAGCSHHTRRKEEVAHHSSYSYLEEITGICIGSINIRYTVSSLATPLPQTAAILLPGDVKLQYAELQTLLHMFVCTAGPVR